MEQRRGEWWRYLTGRPFFWALDGTHPAADLFMLRHVLERPETARPLRAAELALKESAEVVAIIGGLDDAQGALWVPRYSTSLWRLRLLAELGVPGDNERIALALDRVLDTSEERPAPANPDAILVHIAASFGFHGDERVQAALARLTGWLERGVFLPAPERARWLVQAALALAALPADERDESALRYLKQGLASLDIRALPEYRYAHFPHFDHPDVLALARSALKLGLGGDWLHPWVQRVVEMQDEEGLWRLDRHLPTPGGVQWPGEREGAPSRWITSQALYVLRAYYGD